MILSLSFYLLKLNDIKKLIKINNSNNV
jgi:hypothetical protein